MRTASVVVCIFPCHGHTPGTVGSDVGPGYGRLLLSLLFLPPYWCTGGTQGGVGARDIHLLLRPSSSRWCSGFEETSEWLVACGALYSACSIPFHRPCLYCHPVCFPKTCPRMGPYPWCQCLLSIQRPACMVETTKLNQPLYERLPPASESVGNFLFPSQMG